MKTEIIEFKDTDIYCPIENGEIYVAVKPICEALGVNVNGQVERLKRDEMWSQLHVLVRAVGSDSKKRKMFCLPLRYVFGWIMTIDTNQVKDEIKDSLIAYKKECCDILYEHFWGQNNRYKKRDQRILQLQRDNEEMADERKRLNAKIKENKKTINKLLESDINQLDMFGNSNNLA